MLNAKLILNNKYLELNTVSASSVIVKGQKIKPWFPGCGFDIHLLITAVRKAGGYKFIGSLSEWCSWGGEHVS